MRIVKVTLGGEAVAGDVVTLFYGAKGGGRTETGHLVVAGESLADVARDLAFAVETHWCRPLFETKLEDDGLTIVARDNDLTFGFLVEHVVGANHLARAPGGAITVAIAK